MWWERGSVQEVGDEATKVGRSVTKGVMVLMAQRGRMMLRTRSQEGSLETETGGSAQHQKSR